MEVVSGNCEIRCSGEGLRGLGVRFDERYSILIGAVLLNRRCLKVRSFPPLFLHVSLRLFKDHRSQVPTERQWKVILQKLKFLCFHRSPQHFCSPSVLHLTSNLQPTTAQDLTAYFSTHPKVHTQQRLQSYPLHIQPKSQFDPASCRIQDDRNLQPHQNTPHPP